MKILSFGVDSVTTRYMEGSGCTVIPVCDTHLSLLKDLIEVEAPAAVTVDLDKHPAVVAEIGTIRRKNVNVPIAGICEAVPGVSHSERRAMFLEAGGNDLVHLPIHGRELLASLRSLHLLYVGAQLQSVHEVHYGDAVIVLDSAIHSVSINGQGIFLTSKEFQLLEILMGKPGVFIKRQHIMDTMYGFLDCPEGNTIEVFFSRLRKKLFPINTHAANAIETVRRVGYRIQTN